MKAWEKERRLREVAKWMYEENPEIWYTPAAVTAQNAVGQNINLTIEDATEVFQELARRGILKSVFAEVEYEEKGQKKKAAISAWMLDPNNLHRMWRLISGGAFALYVVPVFRFLWSQKGTAWVILISAITLFVTGFLTRAGENAYDRLFSPTTTTGTTSGP